MRKHCNLHLFILIFLFFIVFEQRNFGQFPGDQLQSYLHVQSPQSEDFSRKATTKVSLFTGEVNITIPLYTYKDADFEIPISLQYNTSGFDPNAREGIIGLNWSLNAGGAITRIVNNFPDERSKTQGSGLDLDGTYYASQNNMNYNVIDKNDIFSLSEGTVNGNELWNLYGCEVAPDDFSFFMPGHSGQFHIQNNGGAVFSDNKSYKIYFSHFGDNQLTMNLLEDDQSDFTSEILIVTDDGYRYTFGGDTKYLEYTIPMSDFQSLDDNSFPVVTAWLLKQIETPNGRKVNYNYKSFVRGFLPHRPLDDHHYYLNINRYSFETADQFCTDFNNNQFCEYVDAGTPGFCQELIKTAYLDNISIDDLITIEFLYSEKDQKFYIEPEGSGLSTNDFNQTNNYKLSQILVKFDNATTPEKQIDFTIDYLHGTHGGRLFLTALTELGAKPYLFSYFNTSAIPDPLLSSIDHWGFMNGYSQSAYSTLVPATNYYENGDVTYPPNNIREPNSGFCNLGLLEKITYPTGGWTSFIYQRHDYSKRLERRAIANFLPSLYDETGITGGARILEIHDNDGINADINIREYKYVNDFITSGSQSSGILLEWPRYLIYWKQHENGTDLYSLRRRSSSFNRNHANERNIVHYKEITEVLSPGFGCTNYKFTNFESNADNSDNNTIVAVPDMEDGSVTNVDSYNNYVGLKRNDKSYERGIPSQITKYRYKSNNYDPLSLTSLEEFTQLPDCPNDFTVGVFQSGGLAQSYKNSSVQYLPGKETEKLYTYESNNTQHETTKVTNYEYTQDNLTKIEKFINSDGRELKTEYRYPRDINPNNINSSNDPVVEAFALMFTNTPSSKNMLVYPIEKIKYKDSQVVDATLSIYKQFIVNLPNNGTQILIKPFEEYSLKSNLAIPENQYVKAIINSSGSFIKDSRLDLKTTFDRYDASGNLLQFHETNDITHSTYYGYFDRYPVVKVENANYDNLQNAVVNTNNDLNGFLLNTVKDLTDSQERNQWKEFNTNLRSQASLTNAIVTTYTYKPLIGMTSSTDPNGITTYYEYDTFGRLIYVRDNDYNIMKKYDYHYAGQ